MEGDLLRKCKACDLHEHARCVVMGEGTSAAQLLIIGEAPGQEEEWDERPFVGPAGKLLRRLIRRLSLKEENCFITNICHCHPLDNKLPTGKKLKTYVDACEPHLLFDLFRFFGKVDPHRRSEYKLIPLLRKWLTEKSKKAIVLLGGTPLFAFTGRAAITKYEGRKIKDFAYEKEKWADRVWVAFHPAYALPDRRPAIEVNIYRVLYLAAKQCGLHPTPKTIEEMKDEIGSAVYGIRHRDK